MSWRYRLDRPFRYHAPELIGKSFRNEWLQIHPDGWLEVAARYAWDGCSPSLRLPGGIWIGTPDGPLGPDGRPLTFYASCVHDVLCQFSRDVPLSKDEVSGIFRDMLIASGFGRIRAAAYHAAVYRFGPQDFAANLVPA